MNVRPRPGDGKAWQRLAGVPNLWAAVLFFVTLVLCGGASRGDEPAQIVVRLVSILVLAALWPTVRATSRGELRPLMIILTLATLLCAVQLVPLPPAIWTVLPGREPYIGLADILGTSQPWRPINLSPRQGWDTLVGMLPPFATLIVIVAIDRERLRVTVAAVIIAALFSAVLGVLQLGEGATPLLRTYRVVTASQPSGIFANRNHQALLLALAIPALAMWASMGSDRRETRDLRARGIAALAMVLFLVAVVLATGSRAGLLLLLPAVLAAAYFARTLLPQGRVSRGIVVVAMALGGLIVIAVAISADRSASISRLFESDVVADKRSANLPALIEMAKAFFPIGSGLGSFDPVFRRFEPYETLTFTYFNEAHDDPLQILIEGGLAGGILMLAYLLFWALWSWRAFVAVRPPNRLARLGSVTTLICMAASLVDYPLRTPFFACLFVLANAWLATVAAGSDSVSVSSKALKS